MKRYCIIELYNYQDGSPLTFKYGAVPGEDFMVSLIDILQMANEYGYELISVCPAA